MSAKTAPPTSVRQDEPAPSVDEFAYGVEVTGVPCGLDDHVQDFL
jgi:hypothetical protein